jgi:eukaryotic-like serine/threonine-protein kinase
VATSAVHTDDAAREKANLGTRLSRRCYHVTRMDPQTLGRYAIIERIGAGGMGIVYKARDPRLKRDVAIKVLPPEAASDGDRCARFEHEAQAASALNHPNIATIYEIATDAGTTFIAMEYVPGRTLAETIPRRGLNLSEALRYAVQIADALARAHGSGIIHRDLKPGNIIVTPEGRVKLLDFGLAKLVQRDDNVSADVTRTTGDLTAEGMVVGTTRYMSPEQARGKPVDARTDIFSFGAVLYEMIAGRHAFHGDSVLEIATAVVRDTPKPLSEVTPDVPRDLERIVTRCLRKDPDRRFQTAADLKVALEELREESESGSQPARVPAARRRGMLVLAGIAALALVLALVWTLRRDAPASAVAEMRLLPLTSDPGEEMMPSLSPDGSQVVYVALEPGAQSSDLYVLAVESGARLRLTNDPERAEFPQWSPDGRWIVFRRRDRGLFLISPLGGAERRILEWDQFGDYCWMPDGRRVLFASAASPPVLQALDIQTGEVQPVAEVPHLQRSGPGAVLAVSQDGDLIAVGERDQLSDEGRIVIRRARDGAEQGAIRYGTGGAFAGVAFLPARQGVVFAAGFGPDSVRLHHALLDGARMDRVSDTGHPAFFPTLSAKGDRLAFARRADDENLYRLPLARPGEAGGVPVAFAHSTARDSNPNISFDGQRVAFGSYRSGAPEIYVADATGENAVRLTSRRAAVAGSPRFSPDGMWIAFDSRLPGEQADIFVMSADGGPPRNLSNHPATDTVPTWSRDGRFIYFHSNRSGSSQVWKMRADGSDPRQITRDGGYIAYESVNGEAIFYSKSDTAPDNSLWTAGANGGSERMLVPTLYRHNLAPVKSGVYVSTLRGLEGGSEILFYRFHDQKTETVYRLPRAVALGLSVAPGESWLLFSQLDGSGADLMLIDGFSPGR